MNTYELIVGKDCKYSLEKSPYVMGRIMGILEGSGAETIGHTFRINEGCPMRISFVANHVNRNYILGGSNVLNDLYSLLGLEETDFGEEMGWAPTDEGEFWIEFNHRKAKLDDGTVFYILEMPFEPRVNYDDYY